MNPEFQSDEVTQRQLWFRPLLGLALLLTVTPIIAETTINGRHSLVLENESARLIVDLAGGSISDFHLNNHGLNPLQWESKGGKTEARPMGHFLCLDRWGAPSDEERKNGMPFHGEAARVDWQVLLEPRSNENKFEAEMAAALPLAGLKVKRRIELLPHSPCFVVREEVTNLNKLGRLYNMVQHPTIGPPFLDESTLVDANAGRGFMQSSPLPNPEEPAVRWPEALKKGRPVDIRRLTDDHDPNVVSYTINEDYGWATASSPNRGLLIGYIWRKSEYPWFNVWRHVENGKPSARGLEFGTTGLHQPFPILVAKGRIFDTPIYEYLDAGATASKTYACFLFRVPNDYKGVGRLSYDGQRLVLHERESGPDHDLRMDVGQLFR
ncbi:MAG: hypothetical protein HY735_09335 [Verrucomicrobia bacterium]|nr:hypothetical protein [Verrucomicrobiota bacterium]